MIDTPEGWKSSGHLVWALDEDIMQVSDPSGHYALDVGWYPSCNPDGQFVCRVIVDGDWELPREQLETTDVRAVIAWLRRWYEEVPALLGTQ